MPDRLSTGWGSSAVVTVQVLRPGTAGGHERRPTATAARPRVRAVEKLVYLIWDRPSVDGAALRATYLDQVAPALLALGPHQLSMHLDDDEAPIPGPAPAPGHELPLWAAVSLFVDAHDRREPYEEV